MNQSVRLEDWIFIELPDSAAGLGFLKGSVFGHPHLPDGVTIRTTSILSMDDFTAQTANTVYTLGHRLSRSALSQQHSPVRPPSAFQVSLRRIRDLAAVVTRPFLAA